MGDVHPDPALGVRPTLFFSLFRGDTVERPRDKQPDNSGYENNCPEDQATVGDKYSLITQRQIDYPTAKPDKRKPPHRDG